MKNQKKIKNRSFFFLISSLFLTSLLSIKTLKKIDIQDIRISGSELFSKNDLVNISSLRFPIRLIFIKTNFLEKELKNNLLPEILISWILTFFNVFMLNKVVKNKNEIRKKMLLFFIFF